MDKNQYIANQTTFFDYLVKKKRSEIVRLIKGEIHYSKLKIKSILDIGSSSDGRSNFSNYIVKNLNLSSNIKSITDRKIKSKLFKKTLIKSITKKPTKLELKNFIADLTISSATIEHVGSLNNQKKMIKNIGLLTNKIFVITTPYRFFPIEVHTKVPFIHFFPKKYFRLMLKLFNLDFFSKEENLNLLSIKEMKKISTIVKKDFFIKIKYIKTFFLISNLILIGIKKK